METCCFSVLNLRLLQLINRMLKHFVGHETSPDVLSVWREDEMTGVNFFLAELVSFLVIVFLLINTMFSHIKRLYLATNYKKATTNIYTVRNIEVKYT